MRECVYRCDRCGARIGAGRARIEVAFGMGLARLEIDTATGRPTIDLCDSCVAGLDEYLNAVKSSLHWSSL
jgi:hypothetical protein